MNEKERAKIDNENLKALKDKAHTETDEQLEKHVEEQRITLIDNKDIEHEFIILNELEHNGNTYLALVSCDEKVDKDMDEITVVQKHCQGDHVSISAVSDPQVLLALSNQIEKMYGHLDDH